MSTELTNILRDRLATLRARYAMRFQGHSRVTRDLEILSAIVDGVNEVVAAGRDVGADEDFLTEAEQELATYRTELKQVAEAQDGAAPEDVEAVGLGTRANLVIFKYRRHFAGRPRSSRDLGLLAEMIATLKQLEERLVELDRGSESPARRNLEVIRKNLDLYLSERGEIVAARGMTPGHGQNDAGLAELANDQFATYRAHFAGHSRVTRRVSLLQRVIDNLEQIADRMKAAGGDQSTNRKTVTDQLGFYNNEMKKIRLTQRLAPSRERARALSTEASAILADYRENFAGQDRRTRNVEQLGLLCDRLGDVEAQLWELRRDVSARAEELHSEALDALLMLEREYDLVRRA